MSRGTLRVYLGAAPGVGKTFAMLGEGRRRAERGTDVVVAVAETHGRAQTAAQLDGLEVVPRREVEHRGVRLLEMDLDGVLTRRPQVALVDELAHTNAPGSRNAKRWQDVEALLEAGIDVVTTVNVQHLESLHDVVESITGIAQAETIPDEVVRRADQVELVDMSPEALRRRMAHGNVYPPERIDAALGNWFRIGNLTALRELALLWVADKVDEGLRAYRREHGIGGTWEARERVVVALTGGPEGDTLVRRAARIAARATGGELLAVHVSRSDGLQGASPRRLAEQRALAERLGGSYHTVVGDDVAQALLEFAREVDATQLVLGASRRGRLAHFLAGPGTSARIVRDSGPIDVHLVTHDEAASVRVGTPGLTRGLTRRRRLLGALLALVLLPLLTVALTELRSELELSSVLLLYLSAVVAVALVGGFWPALGAAVVASLLANYEFTEPLYSFTVSDPDEVVAIVVFAGVAAAVASVVDLAARRTRQAARARAEAQVLSTLSGDVLRGEDALPALLDRVRETFGQSAVSLLEREGARWRCVASSGPEPCGAPDSADTLVPAGEGRALALRGRPLEAVDRRVLGAAALQAVAALERSRLAATASSAAQLAEVDRVRTALLAAVGHDLRTPLSAATAAVTSLRGTDVEWSPADRDELLATAQESLERLDRVVGDLLDMSRVQAGVLAVHARPCAVDELVPLVLRHLGPTGSVVEVAVPEDLPPVLVDPGLVERVLVNLLENALRHSPSAVRLAASRHADRVELRVVDRGPGLPAADRERVFAPFQRLGDRPTAGAGVGLGLAVARGFTEAVGGTLTADDTPGGGLTMTVSLPVAA
jgi:two-component system, OmpR family, sensor histidine kinase KdpD